MKCGNLKASSETLTANTILVAGLPVRLSIDSSRRGCVSLPSFEERGEKNGRAGVKITPGWLRQHLKIKVNLNELLFDSDWERWTCPTFRMLLWEKNKNSVQFLCPIKQSSSSNRFPLRDCDCPTRFFVHFQQTAPTQSCQSKWKSNIYNIHTTWLHNPLLLHVPNKTEDSWKHVRGHVQEIVFCVFSKNNVRWVQVSEVSTHCFALNLHFFPFIFNSMDVWPQSSMFAFANARNKITIVNAWQFVERDSGECKPPPRPSIPLFCSLIDSSHWNTPHLLFIFINIHALFPKKFTNM